MEGRELLLFSEKEAIRAGDREKERGQMGDGKEREREGKLGENVLSSPRTFRTRN